MSTTCDCIKKCSCDTISENRSVCKRATHESYEACDTNYLNPISYDELFDEQSNKCTDYNLLIKKLEFSRNAYFSFHTAICNFIGDCTKLKQKARDDISGNELFSLKYDYQILLQNLITTVAAGMRRKIRDDNTILVNFEVPKTRPNKTIEHSQTMWPTDIIYTDVGGIDTLIASIPAVTMYLCSNYQLQVKITAPRGVSYSNIAFDSTYVKTHRNAENEIFLRNLTPDLESIGQDFGFKNSEHANEIFDDIINYSTDENITAHNLKDVTERINSIMMYIENSHRTIIQKMKTEKITQQKRDAK
jgi:hypothetical protein